MKVCEVCGNTYLGAFKIRIDGKARVFGRF